MGQQCSHTVTQVQEVIINHRFEPSSDELKLQIEAMRKKNKELLDVAQKHISQDQKQQYFGYMQNGVKQGYGELRTSGQKQYYGYFKDNVPHIKGALIFSDSHYYIGQFDLGKMHGKGKQVSSHFTFEGQFCFDHKKYGRIVTEEFKYQGSFQQQDSLFSGYGELTFKNGEKYIGNFSRGCFDGEGMYFDQNNSLVYEGGWKKGVYDGVGKYYWEDGSYFQGEYVNGFKHGQGKFTALGEESVHGIWQEGSITSRYVDKIQHQEQKLRNNKSAHSTKVQEIY